MSTQLNRSHFTDDEWTDYVRDLLPADGEPSLQQHLDDRCPSCTKMHATWASISANAKADRQYEPSREAVRVARALFGIRKPEGRFASAVQTVKLMFDSQLAPAPAGFRNGQTGPRRMVYAGEGFLVDIQLQPPTTRGETSMIGQVTAPKSQLRVEGSHVLLVRDGRVIAKATTNRLGEFHMDFVGPASDLSLTLGLERGGATINLGN